jgi:hypothetical protein
MLQSHSIRSLTTVALDVITFIMTHPHHHHYSLSSSSTTTTCTESYRTGNHHDADMARSRWARWIVRNVRECATDKAQMLRAPTA